MEIFAEHLATQTDVADVRTAPPGSFVLVDSRSRQAWDQGHLPGAVHLPTAEIPARAAEVAGPGVAVVTYCWGPGCNGATRAALAFARLGYEVREMIGGVEYWIREGFPIITPAGEITHEPDPLTAPAAASEGAPGALPAGKGAPGSLSAGREAPGALTAEKGTLGSLTAGEGAPGALTAGEGALGSLTAGREAAGVEATGRDPLTAPSCGC